VVDFSFSANKLVIDAGERLFELGQKLDDLRQAEYPSDAPHNLIALLGQVQERLIERLSEANVRIQAADSESDLELQAIFVSRLSLVVAFIYRWLGAIELSEKRYSPRELAAPVEEIARGIDPGCRVLISPIYEENYSYADIIDLISQRLEDALGPSEFQSLLAQHPRHLANISFPSAARGNVLQHAVLAHELGHLVDAVHGVSRKAQDECHVVELLTEKMTAYISQATEGSDHTPQQILEITAQLNDQATELLAGWLGEMTADIYALNLWGLASFFGLSNYLFNRSMGLAGEVEVSAVDLWSDSHPSLRFRLTVMLREIDRQRLQEWLRTHNVTQVADEIDRYTEIASSQVGQQSFIPESPRAFLLSEHALNVAKDVLVECSPGVQDAVRRILVELGCTSADGIDYEKVLLLSSNLERKIPPCEILVTTQEKEVSCSEILNAGWIHRLKNPILPRSWESEESIQESFEQRIETEDNLILRAIDLSYISKTYRQRRKETQTAHEARDTAVPSTKA